MRLGFRASITARRLAITVGTALGLIGFGAASARADLTVVENADNQQGLTVFKMTVTPAAEANPALKHRFMPRTLEMRPGNAALYYYRAFAEHGVAGRWKDIVKAHGEEEVHGGGGKQAWYSPARPFNTMPMDKAREAAAAFDVIVEQCVARATVREDCDWGRNIEELQGLDIISMLLPEMQETRELSRMLMLRTRLAIADGDYERAIDHLRMNYRLGRNVASDPILVSGLVGIAEAALGNNELPELIAAKNSPNLYWALAELPRPFIDLYPATRYELSWGMKIFPVLIDPEKQEHSPEEWARLLANSLRDMQLAAGNGPQFDEWVMRMGVVGFGLLAYPDAKQRLLANGMDAAEIERMPAGQVIAVDASREYQRIAQEFEKWWYTPYSVAKERGADPDGFLRDRFGGGYGRILATLLMPALSKVRSAQMRLDWQLNALQAIEAIRMHAAETKKLPKSLKEITVVPVPKNPVTEKDYEYRLDGDTAILELPQSDGFTGVAWRYEIKLAQ
jgi:hypothetical protein